MEKWKTSTAVVLATSLYCVGNYWSCFSSSLIKSRIHKYEQRWRSDFASQSI